MAVVVNSSADLTLESVRAVAWQGEQATLGPDALGAIARRRREFMAFVEVNTGRHLYGITTRHHHGATHLLSADERAEYGRHVGSAPPGGGPGLPERVVRTVVLARLADILNGTAAVRPQTAAALVAMLDAELPHVPERGHGEAGNIIALGHLLRPVFTGAVEIGEGMALMNGSPVSAALLTDSALTGQGLLLTAEQVFALAAVAADSPAMHYDERLAALWNDEHQTAALRRLRELLDGADRTTTPFQAPVSFRTAPRMLGWARRAQALAEECAGIALAASSNNPVFVGPELSPPLGDVLSNGGFHNPLAAPCLDGLSRSWADLTQLATAQVGRLIDSPDGITTGETAARVGLFDMASAGWAEEARAAAQPSLIGLGPVGRTDTSTNELLAWRRARDTGEALSANLALLAVVAAHTIARRARIVPPALRDLHATVLRLLPLDAEPVSFADALARLRLNLDELRTPWPATE